MAKEQPQLVTMDEIVNVAKRRAFIYPGSEIYGGMANAWDYGPYGVLLKNNVKQAWWEDNVRSRDDMVGLDSAILMNPKVWEAGGHLANFTDPLVEDPVTDKRYRADKLVKVESQSQYTEIAKTEYKDVDNAFGQVLEGWSKLRGDIKAGESVSTDRILDDLAFYKMSLYFVPEEKRLIVCSAPKLFNLMFKTFAGPSEDSANTVYLRPETAQGIFADFKTILDTTRVKLPFGVAQIGKSFRNEITPGNFIFRTREFEQFEIEYFVAGADEAKKAFGEWVKERLAWYESLGIRKENLRLREHEKTELAHYAVSATDVEYNFPFGFSELEGIANRGNFDLTHHEGASGQDLKYFDEETKTKILPHVVEPSGGVDRAVLAFLVDAYTKETVAGNSGDKEGADERIVLKFHPRLAPIKAAVFPLTKKEPVQKIARQIFEELKKKYFVEYDESGTIGRRYRRQDEIGTPICITVDFDTLEDNMVTVRDRDTMQQQRVALSAIAEFVGNKIG